MEESLDEFLKILWLRRDTSEKLFGGIPRGISEVFLGLTLKTNPGCVSRGVLNEIFGEIP